LLELGIDPMHVIQIYCQQGNDVNTLLVLPDGVHVSVDFNEDFDTREIVSINRWSVFGWKYRDRDVKLAREIAARIVKQEFDPKV
jgi:hypothetical protein